MAAPITSGFEVEARQLSDDEHSDLTSQREVMEMDCQYTDDSIIWWERDTGYVGDADEFFQTWRNSFLEEARKMYAEGEAA